MNAIGVTYIMVLIYSPASPYFHGFAFEPKKDQITCAAEAPTRLGEELHLGSFGWEKEMMGPIPKVIGAFCAQGVMATGDLK
jgi:hypothetical protein